MEMKLRFLILIQLSFIIQCQFGDCETHFDFFHFRQQWPGSQCNTKEGCCYPLTGKPKANFIIYKFQPIIYGRSKNPILCDPRNILKLTKMDNESLREHWPPLLCPSIDEITNARRNWIMYGTCSNLRHLMYFKNALLLKNRLKLLEILDGAEIKPDNKSYSFDHIRTAIREEVGFTPIIYCNKDAGGQSQLHEIQFCARKPGFTLRSCPKYKKVASPPMNYFFLVSGDFFIKITESFWQFIP